MDLIYGTIFLMSKNNLTKTVRYLNTEKERRGIRTFKIIQEICIDSIINDTVPTIGKVETIAIIL